MDLVRLDVPLLKNGSDYLTHLPLLRAMARTGLPTMISTGMATFDEIDQAVRAFRGAGGRDLALLHCVSVYPAAPEDVHLRKIPALAEAFGCPVGFSDHTEGVVAAIGAVLTGACVIEKHFTLDRGLPGPDHAFSSDLDEFRALAKGVRVAEKLGGEARLGPAPSEASGRDQYRLSCVAMRDLPGGHTLGEGDMAFRRPGTGIPPAQAELLVGRRLRRAVAAGSPLSAGDME
jgi:N-acetylneuraminate synthase/N,N'-diacetyllegionaminate synthase